MELQYLFDDASRVMTVVSFATFLCIVAWAWLRSDQDLATAAGLPFADEAADLEEDYV